MKNIEHNEPQVIRKRYISTNKDNILKHVHVINIQTLVRR